jgi:hypothetical protein
MSLTGRRGEVMGCLQTRQHFSALSRLEKSTALAASVRVLGKMNGMNFVDPLHFG